MIDINMYSTNQIKLKHFEGIRNLLFCDFSDSVDEFQYTYKTLYEKNILVKKNIHH